jgi:hypothetical protein
VRVARVRRRHTRDTRCRGKAQSDEKASPGHPGRTLIRRLALADNAGDPLARLRTLLL